MRNICLLSDSYKQSHHLQYPPNTRIVSSYMESRGGLFNKTVFFGLQAILKKNFVGRVVTKEKIDLAEKLVNTHIGPNIFNRKGWDYILNEHDGYLPIKIEAVPEGSLVDVSNILMKVTNTDEECFWLTNFVETVLLQTWYPITVATLSYNIKVEILKYLEKTGDPSLINFKLHDFGYRGCSSPESAGLGGMAHLLNFLGTDTLAALEDAQEYYYEPCAGFSIPAAEHSTITSWGRENEAVSYENMLKAFPTGLVAVVSDSYDIYSACADLWGEVLKDKVEAREGTLVIRPDSGEPHHVVVNCLDILGQKFGYTVNDKGYKVLNPKVRVIQGDGINLDSLKLILHVMKQNEWSADNVAFGMGGALLQQVNRDTQKFAFKCSYIHVKGERGVREVYKDPVTDSGKRSKSGKLHLVKKNGRYVTVKQQPCIAFTEKDELQTVFENGKLVRDYSFSDIRKRLENE